MTSPWPISIDDVRSAAARLGPYLTPTPLRSYAPLDREAGAGIRVFVKHENFNPTGAFKVRNAVGALTALPEGERRRGVVAASRGNHGLGLAWAGGRLGIPITVCVPHGNNPEKNEALRGLGASLVEEGRDYDEAVVTAERLSEQRGLHIVHATNDPAAIAGAATLTLEMLEEQPDLEALVFAVGGGSQAVGGMTVARALRPQVQVYAVQAEGASAIHDSWHAGRPTSKPKAETFADGLATRCTYPLTFGALCAGLAGFVAVSEAALAQAVRLILRTTHSLVEGAGAAGLAGLLNLRPTLAGKAVGVVLSGANIDGETLRRILSREL
jgi:threonine dehydratase